MEKESKRNLLLIIGAAPLLLWAGLIFVAIPLFAAGWDTTPKPFWVASCIYGFFYGYLAYPIVYFPSLLGSIIAGRRGRMSASHRLATAPLGYFAFVGLFFAGWLVAIGTWSAKHQAQLRQENQRLEASILAPVGAPAVAPLSAAAPCVTRLTPAAVEQFARRHCFDSRQRSDRNEARVVLQLRAGQLYWSVCFRYRGSYFDGDGMRIADATGESRLEDLRDDAENGGLPAVWDSPEAGGAGSLSGTPVETRHSQAEALAYARRIAFGPPGEQRLYDTPRICLRIEPGRRLWLIQFLALTEDPRERSFYVEFDDGSGVGRMVRRDTEADLIERLRLGWPGNKSGWWISRQPVVVPEEAGIGLAGQSDRLAGAFVRAETAPLGTTARDFAIYGYRSAGAREVLVRALAHVKTPDLSQLTIIFCGADADRRAAETAVKQKGAQFAFVPYDHEE